MVYRRVWFPFLHCGNVALFIGGVINGKDIPWNINICCYTWNCDGTGQMCIRDRILFELNSSCGDLGERVEIFCLL